MDKVRWGIIGLGSIANNFADALISCYSGELKGIASRSEDRLKNYGNKYNINESFRFSNYDDLLNSEDIDAVYISTPHTFHADLTIKAAGKGKHILCEKPGAVNFKEGQKVIEAVQQAGVFYKEGFMYRCHPQIPALIKILKENRIGTIQKIISSFGFDMEKTVPESRLFQKDLAGGSILDVGLYPISFSRLIAGIANKKKFINPKTITGKAIIGETGVDVIAHGVLEFENDIIAEVSTAIRENMINNAVIIGSEGKIELDQPWTPGRNGGPYHSTIKIHKDNKVEKIDFKGPEHLFFFEAELSSQTIIKQKLEAPYPAMTWEDTLGNLKTLDQWRHAVGYSLDQD